MQNDGDLWEEVWNTVRNRGSWTIRVSKVKGHATQRVVDDGEAREVDKIGNYRSGEAADR